MKKYSTSLDVRKCTLNPNEIIQGTHCNGRNSESKLTTPDVGKHVEYAAEGNEEWYN